MTRVTGRGAIRPESHAPPALARHRSVSARAPAPCR
jgi:hypothetical protein